MTSSFTPRNPPGDIVHRANMANLALPPPPTINPSKILYFKLTSKNHVEQHKRQYESRMFFHITICRKLIYKCVVGEEALLGKWA